MAEHLASILGTEKDRVNCPFYFKIGACRHGDRCSRLHNRPTVSPTLLLSNMYQRPDMITPGVDAQGNPIEPRKIQEHFEDFYEDIFEELNKFGEIETLNVCDNLADHMIGNVYVQFREEDQAAAALKFLTRHLIASHARKKLDPFPIVFFLPIALLAFLILDQQKVTMFSGHKKSGEMGSLNTYKAHVMVLAYHGQGHINPMVQFSKRLASKGLKITVSTTLSNTKAMVSASSPVTFESIYDDITEGGVGAAGGFKAFLDRFEASGSRNLIELIKKQKDSNYPVKCLVYDANIPWASDIAKKFAIPGAAFFTQSCAAIASYYPMHYEILEKSLPLPAFSMPGLPPPKIPYLPSLGAATGKHSPIIQHICKQFDNAEDAKWVLFNSFNKLEEEVVMWMSNLWTVKNIGPTIPAVYLDKRVENDNDYGFNMYKPNTEACMQWLDTKKTGSVVYVSFGSAASLNAEQMAEMGEALKQSSMSFLWVVKPTEESKLPSKFIEETSEKGLIVSWCPQLEVLAHNAVGCFVSHCGWNSIVEAVSFGVPVVAMPQFLDQMTNAYFVEKVWAVGIQPKENEENRITAEEIGRCINEVMNGEEIRKRAIHRREMAKEAIDENGSSDKHIDEIISQIVAL